MKNSSSRPSSQEIADDLDVDDIAQLREVLKIAEAAQAGKPVDEGELVRVYHQGKGAGRLLHGTYSIGAGEFADVPKSVADLWAGHQSFGRPLVILASEMPANASATARVEAEKEKLSVENQALSDRVKQLEALVAAAQGARASDANPTPGEAALATLEAAVPAAKKLRGQAAAAESKQE